MKALLMKDGKVDYFKRVVSGASAGIAFWIPALPFDIVKAHLLTDKEKKSALQHIRNIYKVGGLSAFYKGFYPCFVRAAAVSSVTLPVTFSTYFSRFIISFSIQTWFKKKVYDLVKELLQTIF